MHIQDEPSKIKIGKIALKDGFKHQISYETAAWHSELALDGGEYDVYLHLGAYIAIATESIPAVYTEDYTPSMFGGVVYGKNENNNIGRRTSHALSLGGSILLPGAREPGRDVQVLEMNAPYLEPTVGYPYVKINRDHSEFKAIVEAHQTKEHLALLHTGVGFTKYYNAERAVNNGWVTEDSVKLNRTYGIKSPQLHASCLQVAMIIADKLKINDADVSIGHMDIRDELKGRTGELSEIFNAAADALIEKHDLAPQPVRADESSGFSP